MQTLSQARQRGGFTLLELVIATVLLSLMLGAMGLVQMRARDASRVGMAREQVETTCRRSLDRVADELQGVVRGLLFPDPSTSLGTGTITYTSGRTNVLQGAVHLMLLMAYLMLIIWR